MKLESQHDAVNEILPWYVNGTLAPQERRMVEEHVKECEGCQEEMAFLKQLDSAAEELVEDTPPLPSSLGKTLAAIDEWEQNKASSAKTGIAGLWKSLWNPPPLLARSLLTAQLAVIVALGGFLWSSRTDSPSLTTLSGGGVQAGGVRLTVIFEPGTSAENIRQTLVGIAANVVSGPSAIGVYIVELPVSAADAVDQVIQKLRGNPAVIRFVERQP